MQLPAISIRRNSVTFSCKGRSIEAPQLHILLQSLDEYLDGEFREPCAWVQTIMHHVSRCRSSSRRRKSSVNIVYNNEPYNADAWQQVLRGARQRVQGSNGLNAAQLSCPQGATLTFQLNVGVSCGTGSRHGVTTHPRGRHLRGVMTLLPRGMTQMTAREQQPSQRQQPQPLGIMAHYRN